MCVFLYNNSVRFYLDVYLFVVLDYVNDIYDTLIETPRAELKQIKEELEQTVPPHMHTMLDKEEKEEVINRYKSRKEMQTPICPPTCTGK
jgi:hypothetical protein